MPVPRPKVLSQDDAWFPSTWFPDGSRIVASAIRATPDGQIINSAWSVPVLGSSPVLLRDDAVAPSVSPDGSLIAFTRGSVLPDLDLPDRILFAPWAREIWVMGPNGEDAKKLMPSDGKTIFRHIQWSPDGSRIACLERHPDSKAPDSADVGAIALKGGNRITVLPSLPYNAEFRWLPDGRVIYDQYEHRDANLWAAEGRFQKR